MKKQLAIHKRHNTPIGLHCPANLLERSHDWDDTYVMRLSRWYDDEGHERGERINGFDQCPACGLWWPCVEEPDCWEEGEGDNAGRWVAIGWWGAVVCCGLLMIEQPDGRGEVYSLR